MAIRRQPVDNEWHMSHRTRALVLLVSTPLVVLVLVGGLLGQTRLADNETLRHLRVFSDVQQRIFTAYVEPADVETVMDGAMRGLAEALDPLSAYLRPDEVRFVESGAMVPTGDVGVVVTRQYYLRVVGVREGSPAALAGLHSGDFIRAIDEKPTRDMSVFAGARLLRGPAGSRVKLLVIRTNPADPQEVTLVRETPGPARAASRILPGGEAYVRVSSFESGAAAALRQAVTAVGAPANSGVLIDVRDVADGTIEEGVAAARLFVTDGVLSTRIARNVAPVVVRATPGDGALRMKVIVLVSNGTGRAAEVFAAALANSKRADLVGEPTAGLASVQKLIKLPDDHGLWLTTERYVQADGSPLDGRGLRPTVAVETPVVDFGAPTPLTDPVLSRAVDHLRGRVPPAAELQGRGAAAGTPAAGPQPGSREVPPTTEPGSRPALPPTTEPQPR